MRERKPPSIINDRAIPEAPHKEHLNQRARFIQPPIPGLDPPVGRNKVLARKVDPLTGRNYLEVELQRGEIMLVEANDWPFIAKYRWFYIEPQSGSQSGRYKYAAARVKDPKTNHWSMILLHRELLRLTKFNEVADHIDGNTLDNRRPNLRRCTRRENLLNSKLSMPSKTGYRGIRYVDYRFQVRVNKKYIGRVNTLEEAMRLYNKAAFDAYGRFARLYDIDQIRRAS